MKFIKFLINRIRGEQSLQKLKKEGLKIGDNFYCGKNCFFDPSHTFLIEIGNNVTFSHKVHLLAHDASTKIINGYVKIGQVIIKNNVFVGANVTILPGVTIGDNTIIGAGSVVTKSIPSNSVACGNPCKVICSLDDYKKKYNGEFVFFDETYTMRNNVSYEKKQEMKKEVSKRKIAFIK